MLQGVLRFRYEAGQVDGGFWLSREYSIRLKVISDYDGVECYTGIHKLDVYEGSSAFVVFAGLQLAPTLPQLSWLHWNANNLAMQILAAMGAIALMAYTGFALGVVNSITAWNTALMPVLFIVYSFLGGAGLAMGILAALDSAMNLKFLELTVTGFLVIAALLMGIYLWITYSTGPAGRKSVIELLRGRASPFFIGGVVFFDLVVPLVVAGYAITVDIPSGVLIAGSASELIGGFSLRYSILKVGIYVPLI